MKQPKTRKLSDVLEPGFAEGYERFKEMVEWAASEDLDLPAERRAWAKLFQLSLIAAIEGLNTVEDQFEIPPHEAAATLWSVLGAVAAAVNAQGFTREGQALVRREMLSAFREGYANCMRAMTGVGA